MHLHKVNIILLAALLALIPLCAGTPAWSADESGSSGVARQKIIEASSEIPDDDTDQMLKRINASFKRLKRYMSRLSDAGAEDREVLQLQIYNERVAILQAMHRLADVLLELEKKAPQPELRREMESAFTRIVPQFWHHIGRLRNDIDKARAQRSEADVESLQSIEYEIAKLTKRLDVFFRLSFEHLLKMETVGMAVETPRRKLSVLLTDRSDELTGRIKLALMRIEDLEKQRKDLPDSAAISARLVATRMGLNTNVASLQATLDLMENLDLDTRAPRALLVTATHDIGSGLLDTGVAFNLAHRTTKRFTAWIIEKGPGYLIKALALLAILSAFIFASRVIRAGLDKALRASNLNLSTLARRMLISTASKLVVILGIMVILSQIGISLGPLLAGLGVVGFIVGFALQDSLSNFAAGVMILLYRPYDVGDFVDVGGVFGAVERMSLVSTSLLTIDNQVYIVPNSKIWGDVIKNVTAQKLRRVDMVFGISYRDDVEKAEAVLADILKSHGKVLDYPESKIRLHKLGESSVDFVVRPWVKVDDYWDVYWDITRAVKLRFDEENISIPFPQRDVHLYNEDKEK
ncbi:MAG: mechanosensitive ion channel [Deltaproteobacteria bacterium]|nr:mechanosensitive ion channel [Deltaproteobacteria bacterium]